MGWRGTVRSLAAVARRMEKEAERRHKQALKDEIAADAADAVADWEGYIDELLSIHTNLADRVDWQSMLSRSAPEEPLESSHPQDRARKEFADFRPRVLDFLRGGSAKRKASLEAALASAIRRDTEEFSVTLKNHHEAFADWQNDEELARRLIAGETEAIKEVISELQSLSKTDLIGSAVEFSIRENFVHAKSQVHTDEIIPSFRRKQLASGKLSETEMPAGQFNELYQDYVASVALKVAGDLFQLLPLDEVYVTCVAEMLNSSTGHKEPTPILSVHFVSETMNKLRLADIDPSDSMANFSHAMSFKKANGFSAVTPLVAD